MYEIRGKQTFNFFNNIKYLQPGRYNKIQKYMGSTTSEKTNLLNLFEEYEKSLLEQLVFVVLIKIDCA